MIETVRVFNRWQCARPNRFSYVISFLFLITYLLFTGTTMANLRPVSLRCEYRVNPLGVDNAKPRLGWHCASAERGQRQTAYRIVVASSKDLLARDSGDLWDSGIIKSRETYSLPYGGKQLKSGTECYWKVRIWDAKGEGGDWSDVAFWTMGLLSPSDWRAEWIGYDSVRDLEAGVPFSHSQWICSPMNAGTKTPPTKGYFARVIEIPAGVRVLRARVLGAGDDCLALSLNGKQLAASAHALDTWRTPVQHDVTQELQPGKNVLLAEVENLSGDRAALLAWAEIHLNNGTVLIIRSDRSWQTTATLDPNWQKKQAAELQWDTPQVLGNFGNPPWRYLCDEVLMLPPPRYLFTSFDVMRSIRRAQLYVAALGLCEVYIGGRRISDDYFLPGWTDYARRVYYRTYDVASLLREGQNTLGVILADGWFSGYIGYAGERDHYGKKVRARVQLQLEYTDGTTETVASGAHWGACKGPLLEADFLMGETYDASVARADDFGVNSDVAGADSVDVGAEVDPLVQAHPGNPVRVVGEFVPRSLNEPQKGVYVFDLGQNIAGVVRLRVMGQRGQRITLRYAERLNPDGTLYTMNLRCARATDTYICRGEGEEVWQPRFTFHGFQYVEVTGLSSRPGIDMITGLALSSDTPLAGSFQSSDPMLNKLASNVLWTQRANFIDVPTDCPQRDERLGWTGDAQAYIRSACLNADVQAFFHKWILDLQDAQRADGQFPMVAPLKVAGDDGGPAWADAGVICPWTIYEMYGDTAILASSYPSMKKFVDFCRNRSTQDMLPPKDFHCFGDWVNIGGDTPKDVIFSAYAALSTKLTARAARVLGKEEDARSLEELFATIRGAFNREYVSGDGRIKGNTQTAYVLALVGDLLDHTMRDRAAQYLVDDIASRGWHLSTGFVGTKDIMHVLSLIGRVDVAYRLLFNETFPSWGFTIKNGATSIWERWDGWTPEKGFQDPGMNSFAHYAFGAVYQWMVENIGGIRPLETGFGKVLIAPQPHERLTWAQVGYTSVRGPILSSWRAENGRFTLEVEVPANTEAEVHLPATGVEQITESGRRVTGVEGVTVSASEKGMTTLKVGSGKYVFVSAL